MFVQLRAYRVSHLSASKSGARDWPVVTPRHLFHQSAQTFAIEKEGSWEWGGAGMAERCNRQARWSAQISPRVDLEFGEDLPTSRDSSELGWGGARVVPYQSDNSLMGTQDAARMSDGERHSLLLASDQPWAARASEMHSPFKARLSRCDEEKRARLQQQYAGER